MLQVTFDLPGDFAEAKPPDGSNAPEHRRWKERKFIDMRNKKKDLFIVVLPIVLFLGVIFLGVLRIKRGISIFEEVDSLFIVFYIIGMLAESIISKKDYNTEEKEDFDSGTCKIYALGQGLTFLTALWFPPMWKTSSILLLFPFILFCFGLFFRLWAVRTLGKFYSHKVYKIKDHRIIDFGPYRFIRHPAYTGMIIGNAGITIYFFNWVTTFCFAVVLIPAIVLRIKVEEKMLFEIEGYSTFALKRKRIFPGIW